MDLPVPYLALPEALARHLADGLLTLDAAARIVCANPAAAALLGVAPEALAGRAFASLVVEDTASLLAAQPPGEAVAYQLGARCPDGAARTLQAVACAIEDAGRRSYMLILRDSAPQQEQAWRARAAGERRHKTFTQASHELRTPLASILGFSELLLKREFDAAGRQELLDIVHQQAGRMHKVVTQVFDLARIEAGGRAALRLAPTPLQGVLVQALGSVAALGQNERVVLEVAPGLAPAAADPARLAQALGIALDNALRYSAPGTPVVLRASAAGPSLQVEIRDAGPGMTPALRELLFEPFGRGRRESAGSPGLPAPDAEGTGLGMAIFREIMDLHQATVEVDSSPGAGTTLRIRLPAAGGSGG